MMAYAHQRFKSVVNIYALTGPASTGTAGVPPASSNGFTQRAVERVKFDSVAFNESGRDARGPSNSGRDARGPSNSGRDANGPSNSGRDANGPSNSGRSSDLLGLRDTLVTD